MPGDFISDYLIYADGSEVPPVFHRWSIITGLAAWLERSIHIPFGHSEIYPNIYCMLIGTAGTRKSTAIKLTKKLLSQAGYRNMAAEKTSKEKYLADLSAQHDAVADPEDVLERNIWGDREDAGDVYEHTPSFIAADEANDFFGIGNAEFLSLLGSLWDWNGKYENKTKHGKSDFIPNPTISILAGNTPTGFALAFPPTIFGQGFFSRLLLIYGEPSGKRITLPKTPGKDATVEVVRRLQEIKLKSQGEFSLTSKGMMLLDMMYQNYKPSDDPRFDSFSNRRIIHLLKLCLVIAACKLQNTIDEYVLMQANTYLTYAEKLMPKALGEFGRSKTADATHKILELINKSDAPVQLDQIWKHVMSDFTKTEELSTVIRNLSFAKKIQYISGAGYLPNKEVLESPYEKLGLIANSEFLTKEELGVSI